MSITYFNNKWGATNNKSELLYHICKLYKLDFLGPDFNTFYSGNKKGKPDIILGNHLLNIFNKHISQGPRVGSDHIPVQIELDTKPILITTTDKILDYSKANWESLKEKLSPIIPPVLDKESPNTIDNAVVDLFEHINIASRENIPMK